MIKRVSADMIPPLCEPLGCIPSLTPLASKEEAPALSGATGALCRLFKVEETPSTPKLYYNRAVAAVAGLLRHQEKGAERDGREQ